MATHVMKQYADRKKRVVFMVHRREIVHDIVRRLAAHGIDASRGIYNNHRVRVVSVQRALRAKIQPVDLLVVDEAHHYAADEWKLAMERVQAKRVLGFTATPQRADGRPLGDMFEGIVDVVSYKALVKLGFLTPCRVLRPPERIQKTEIAQDPAEAYLNYARGERCIIFVRRIAEAHAVAEKLRAQGVRAEAVWGKMASRARDATMLRLENGQLDVVANVGILTEGVDVPHVTTLVLARPCAHQSTYVQIVGRVLRACPGKKRATLIDLVGASFTHGLPNQEREYSLDGEGMRLIPLREDSRSGPSGPHKPMEDYEVLDLDLEEVAPGDFRVLPPPPPKPLHARADDELTPKELALRLKRRAKAERQKAGLPDPRTLELQELVSRYGGEMVGPVGYTRHGTTFGFLSETRGFWVAIWSQNGKRSNFGLATKDKGQAEELLHVFRSEGPDALRKRVLQHKRSAVCVFRDKGAGRAYRISYWNAERTKRKQQTLYTTDRQEAEEMRLLFERGDMAEFELRQRLNRDRHNGIANEKRSEALKRAHAEGRGRWPSAAAAE